MRATHVAVAALMLAGCLNDEKTGKPRPDADGDAITDSITFDGVADDTSVPDTSVPDTFVADTHATDTSVVDTDAVDSAVDTTVVDTTVVDTMVVDTTVLDTAVADTAVADTAVADTGFVDTGVADTAPEVSIDSAVPTCGILVTDDFRSGTIAPERFRVVTTGLPGAGFGVTVVGGAAHLTNRAHLVTTKLLEPTAARPLRVTGTLTVVASGGGDVITISTRSDGTPFGASGATRNALGCSLSTASGDATWAATGAATLTPGTKGAPLGALPDGARLEFEVVDDGSALLCTFRKLGTHVQTYARATSAYVATPAYVSFNNREDSGVTHTVGLDNLSIELGVVRPSAHWTFDEPSGDIYSFSAPIVGSVGSGITRNEGRNGNGLTLTGADQYVDFGVDADRLGTEPFTIALWVKTSSKTNMTLIGDRRASGCGNFWGARFASGSLSFEQSQNTACLNQVAASGTSAYGDGLWHHVVLVRDGATLSVFEDGALIATKKGDAAANLDNTASMRLGFEAASVYPAFAGSLDDFRFYPRVLSGCEISVLASPNP